MTSRLIYKSEVRPGIFVVCTLRHNEYQVQLQHEHGIRYQQTDEPQRAIDIIREFTELAQSVSQ
jgi:hypothetical protein